MTAMIIRDLFATDIERNIEEVIKVDQTDEQLVREELAEYVATEPSSRRNETSGIRHSWSHWRQPPHGDALTPIATMSPGR